MMKRILMVDDSSDSRLFMRLILEKENFIVSELASAIGLDDAITEFKPDLILCDVMMPGEDGLSVCKRIRSRYDGTLPIILVSAKFFERDKQAALEAGAMAYVTKPIRAVDLIEAVKGAFTTRIGITIWGSRGSIATPDFAQGMYGGNTSCVDILLPHNQHLIFDAGTGIRPLGKHLMPAGPLRTALFLTHFHWDHIQGLPFFAPLYSPANEIHIYGPANSNDELVETIEGQMGGAFFPVSTAAFRSTIRFFGLREQELECFGISISTLYMLHPGRTLAYRLNIGDQTLIYAPDNELLPEMVKPELSSEALRLAEFAEGASLLIHDCGYTRSIYDQRRGWGHSCGECLAEVVAQAGVKRVLLFHHDPSNDDEAVQAVHQEFQACLPAGHKVVGSEPAREGVCYTV